MVQINEVVPSRFQVGDLITIRGFGFSPTFGSNEVAIAGIPEPIQSESATELQLFVPAGVPADEYVSVAVFRSDTLDNDVGQAWSQGSTGGLRDGSQDIPGQIPGETESSDPTRVEDTPQAQDYERMVTALQHLLLDTLGAVGDVFASDGSAVAPHPIGAAGQRLGANPATSTGMEYAAIARAQTLAWAGRKLAANTVVDAITANGESNDTSIVTGVHMAPLTGNVYAVVVLFAEGAAGDTLDQVIIRTAGAITYNSGTGLGIVPGGFHVATMALAVTVGVTTIELEVRKLGTNADGDFVGHVGVR